MKAIILFSIILVFLLPTADARNITGKIHDSNDDPVEYANVTLFAGDSIIGGCMTDSIGRFSINIAGKCDTLRVSFIGYDNVVLPVVTDDVGKITISQTSRSLKEVVVKAQLIRREADRIVLNIAANPLAANKNAQELLRTAPGVWATDNSLSIYGQSGTTVYIDDRKVNMSGTHLLTYLRTIQSSSIAAIEIIPQGGAEYDAESSGGIIIIRLKKKHVDGFNGTIGLNTILGKYKASIAPLTNLSLHSGKWTVNIMGNISYSPSERYRSFQSSENSNLPLTLNGVSFHKKNSLNGSVTAGIFYDPTDKDNLGFQVDYNPSESKNHSESETEGVKGNDLTYTNGRFTERDNSHNVNLALNWSHKIDDKGSVFKFISNYNFQSSSVDNDNMMSWLPERKDSVYNAENSNIYNIFVSELSLLKRFKLGWEINTGIKFTHNSIRNKSIHRFMQNGNWNSDPEHDYDSDYNENILAFFSTLKSRAGRWGFKAGLRGEYFNKTNNVFSNSNLNLFPNANISFNLTERGDYTASAGYYRIISRPSFWSLNPVVRQHSDYSYSVGNPQLKPSSRNSFSLDIVLAGKFTVASGYSVTNNPIRQVFTSTPGHPERMYLTWENIGSDRSGFIHGDGFVAITGWWSLYTSLTWVFTSQKMEIPQGDDKFNYLQLVGSTTFRLPEHFNLTINCFYQSKMKIGNIKVYPMLNINPTIQRKFGDKWSTSIGLENILQRKSKIRAVSNGIDRLTYSRQHLAVKCSIMYNFSSGKKFRSPRIEKNTDNSRLTKE